MRKAYDAIILREDTDVLHPEDLYTVIANNSTLLKGTYTVKKNFMVKTLAN